ncbi:MAG: hypothetical protein PVG33_11125 [Chloroflexota bacterium]|jgi:4-amino-4-deoxy-L-arabinose transferase-like glycosyltransferase
MTIPQEAASGQRRRIRLSWWNVTLLVILLLAAGLRFWRLDSLPPGLQHDEAYNGLDALALLARQEFPIFHEGWELYADIVHQGPVFQSKTPAFLEGNYGREPLVAYLMAASILIGGATPVALRAVVALAGSLAVLSTYGAALELTGGRRDRDNSSLVDIMASLTPLLAAFVVAVFFPAILLSRVGLRAMLFVPLEGLVVFLFWRGVRQAAEGAGSDGQQSSAANILGLAMTAPRWFGAAGLFLGLSLYSYGAARFLPLVFAVFVPIWLWRDRAARRRHLGDVVLMAVVALIAVGPLLLFMARHSYYAIYRSRVVLNRGAGTFPGRPWITWSYNVWRVLSGLVWRGDPNLLRNLPGRPFMDAVQVLLAGAGLVSIVARRLNWRRAFLLIWLVIMAAPSVLTGDAPHFARLVGLIPPLAIVIASGGAWLVELIAARTEKTGERATMLALAGLMALLLSSGGLAVWDYFGRYADEGGLAALFSVDDWQLGQYAAALPKGEIIYLSPTQEQMATIYFALEGDRQRLRSYYSPNGTLIPAGNEGESAFYLVRPRAAEAIDLLARRFPQGSIDLSYPSFTAFLLPADVPRFQTDGEPLTWAGAIALHEWSAEQVGDRLVVTLVWQAKVEMERSYTAYVHLLSADAELLAQLDRLPDGYPTSDWQPGEIIIDRYTIQLPPNYQPGSYYLQTGFYFLPTQERLGEPAVFGQVILTR